MYVKEEYAEQYGSSNTLPQRKLYRRFFYFFFGLNHAYRALVIHNNSNNGIYK